MDTHPNAQLAHRKRHRPPHPNALSYGVDEAAAVLGICRRSIYELINSGQLESRKILGRRLIPRAALERLLAEAEAA